MIGRNSHLYLTFALRAISDLEAWLLIKQASRQDHVITRGLRRVERNERHYDGVKKLSAKYT